MKFRASKLSEEINETSFFDYFDESFAGQVASVHVAVDVRELTRNIGWQTSEITKMNAIATGLRVWNMEQYAQHRAKLADLQEDEVRLRQGPFAKAQNVFVTFHREIDARAFVLGHAQRSLPDCDLELHESKVEMAPVPADMCWENIAVRGSERRWRTVGSCAVTGLVFVCFIAIACVLVFILGFDYMRILYHAEGYPAYVKVVDSVKDVIGRFLFYGVCSTLIALAFLLLEEQIPPVVKRFTKFECYISKSKKQAAYLSKCYGHYLVYHLIMSTFFLGLMAVLVEAKYRVRLYLECVGCFHCNRMMLTVAIVDAFHWFEGVKFFRRVWKPSSPSSQASSPALTPIGSPMMMSAQQEPVHDSGNHTVDSDPYFNNKFDFSRNYAETMARQKKLTLVPLTAKRQHLRLCFRG